MTDDDFLKVKQTAKVYLAYSLFIYIHSKVTYDSLCQDYGGCSTFCDCQIFI